MGPLSNMAAANSETKASTKKASKKAKEVRLTLRGLVATPDKVGRLRFLLLNELKCGRKDESAVVLNRFIPAGEIMPYLVKPECDGVVGEFVAAIRKTKMCTNADLAVKYASWRNKEVEVDVITRHVSRSDGSGQGTSLLITDMRLYGPAVKK